MSVLPFSMKPPRLVDFLLKHGWRKDPLRDGLMSPEGAFVPSTTIIQHEQTFMSSLLKAGKADKAADFLDAFAYSMAGAGVPPPPQPGDLYVNVGSHFEPVTPDSKKYSPYSKLKMRLDMGPKDELGFHCNIVPGPNKIHIFVAKGDKALILEDDVFLFPSDKLVAQIRLWQGSIRND